MTTSTACPPSSLSQEFLSALTLASKFSNNYRYYKQQTPDPLRSRYSDYYNSFELSATRLYSLALLLRLHPSPLPVTVHYLVRAAHSFISSTITSPADFLRPEPKSTATRAIAP